MSLDHQISDSRLAQPFGIDSWLGRRDDLPHGHLVGVLFGQCLFSRWRGTVEARTELGSGRAGVSGRGRRGHLTDFSLEWALKDLDLAETATGGEVIPVAELIAERWRRLVETANRVAAHAFAWVRAL